MAKLKKVTLKDLKKAKKAYLKNGNTYQSIIKHLTKGEKKCN